MSRVYYYKGNHGKKKYKGCTNNLSPSKLSVGNIYPANSGVINRLRFAYHTYVNVQAVLVVSVASKFKLGLKGQLDKTTASARLV